MTEKLKEALDTYDKWIDEHACGFALEDFMGVARLERIIDAARAYLTQWQPIDTVPDARYVLLTNGFWSGIGMKYINDPYEEDVLFTDEHHEFIEPSPTHWMLLPNPPEERD